MTRNLYVASAEPRSGKTLVLLGVMEFLSRRAQRVGFFRPIITSLPEQDDAIHLVAQRYQLAFSPEQLYGCTFEVARDLVTRGRYQELLERILDKYKELERQCDFVLCAGTDFNRVATVFEFDFNADVANNLGSLILPIVNGHQRSADEITGNVQVLLESLHERGCEILAVLVNRVVPEKVDSVTQVLGRSLKENLPFYVLPECTMLGMPTVGEVAQALDARWLTPESEGFDREVMHYKVAAMETPHFLDHLEDGSLVITPGDRSDIIIASLMANNTPSLPKVAGLVLTGGLEPAPQVRRLMKIVGRSTLPVLSVSTDTFVTAMNVSSLEGAVVPENERKIAAALGIVENHLNEEELQRRIAVTRTNRTTPLMFQYELVQRAKAAKQRIVLPEGNEERILRAAEILTLRGVVDLLLLGNEAEIQERIESLGLSLGSVQIIDPAESAWRGKFAQTYYEMRRHKGISKEMAFDAMIDVSYFGTMMVYHDEVDGMVSGAVHTTQHTIRPAFEIIKTRPGCSIISSVFFMCLEDRVLVYGDCAVNPNPNAEQLADIAVSSAATAERFGIEPRVAMLSYSTGESGKGKDVDKVREATRIARSLRPDLKLEGPMQYDAAVDTSVARSKIPNSAVAGNASVFIFPDLNTGNNTYKAVQRSANALAIGPILQGLKKPVNDLSRGCTVPDIVNTVAITAIQAQASEDSS